MNNALTILERYLPDLERIAEAMNKNGDPNDPMTVERVVYPTAADNSDGLKTKSECVRLAQ